eukprot:12725375-Alexandrium_andersonii.AAC.1
MICSGGPIRAAIGGAYGNVPVVVNIDDLRCCGPAISRPANGGAIVLDGDHMGSRGDTTFALGGG